MNHFTIIGAGIVGLATALKLNEKLPKAKITIIPNGIYINQHKFQKISKEEFVNQFSQTSSSLLLGIDCPEFISGKQFPLNPTPLPSLRGTKQSLLSPQKVENVNRIIISMGRIHKMKAFDVLIKAFDCILKEFPNSYLFIAGNDDGEKENLIKIIDELNLQENVFFTGQLDNERKAMFLGNADVFALASHTENFGNV